jgi:uncharacterized protein (TIGR02145 family)
MDFSSGTLLQQTAFAPSAGLYWFTPNAYATNESGFAALPGRMRSSQGSFSNFVDYAYFWSSTPLYTYNARNTYVSTYAGNMTFSSENRELGFRVRCLKD